MPHDGWYRFSIISSPLERTLSHGLDAITSHSVAVLSIDDNTAVIFFDGGFTISTWFPVLLCSILTEFICKTRYGICPDDYMPYRRKPIRAVLNMGNTKRIPAFSSFRLSQNLSPNLLAPLCGVAFATVFQPILPETNSDIQWKRGKAMTAEEKPQKKPKGEKRKWRATTRSTSPRPGKPWTSSRCRRPATLMFPLPIECWWNDSKIFDLTDGFQNPETFKYRINTYG